MILFRLLRWTSGFAFFPILIVLYYGFKAVQGVFNGQKWAFNEWIEIVGHELYGLAGDWSRNIIIASLIALLLTNSAIHQLVGINNLNIEPDGTYCFYVAATKNGEKTYTLPAQIRVEEEHEEVDERTEKIYRYYFIERVYFSNGGYLDTEDLDAVKIDEPAIFYDNSDNEWELILLNKHAYTPEIKETNNASWVAIAFLIVEVSSIAVVLYALSKTKNHTVDTE